MLFILTGDVQTGKTRWLSRLIERLETEDVVSYGVLAPGIWNKTIDPETGETAFDKLGIDNVLLPRKERVSFALRRDIAQSEGRYDSRSQSASAHLLWAINDEAIGYVNRHFETLAAAMAESGSTDASRGLLVVDEFGQLELRRRQGLTAAVRLVEAGPNALCHHALIVVREWLCDLATERFSPAWPDTVFIKPDASGRECVDAAFDIRA